MARRPLFRIHRQPRAFVTPAGHVQKAGTATIASAVIIHTNNRLGKLSSASEWQRQVWELYDLVTEIRFGSNWIGNACGRARLYVGKIDKDGSSGPIPIEEEDNPDESLMTPLNELFGGQLGQSEMLNRFAVHLSVPGETYMVGYDDPDTGERVWQVASSDEVTPTGYETVKVRRADQDCWVELNLADGSSQLLRMWKPHPRIAWLPDSPLLSLRQTAQEILDLSGHISASAKSRLAGAGLLFLPDSIDFPNPDQAEGGVNPAHSDVFKNILMEAMSAPIRDREHPSAMVPIIISGPAEAADAIKWMTFSTPLDANASDLRDAAVRRLAVGLDMPSEILTGLGDSNHWCVDEATEILTSDGWKDRAQLTVGELVLTWDQIATRERWVPVEKINVFEVADELMYRFDLPELNAFTTANHRWPVRRDGVPTYATSETLAIGDVLLTPGGEVAFDPARVSTERFTGTVWCPTTDTTTWCARRAGTAYYTGNSAWAIEESAIKLHVEPMLGLMCSALTTDFYRPALEALGRKDADDWVIWYDASSLVQRPNRGPDALQAHDTGLISDDATRRELGFSKDDAPSEDERRRRLIEKVVLTNTNLAPVLLPELGVETGEATGGTGGAGMPQAPAAQPNDDRGLPPQAGGAPLELPQGTGVYAAYEMAVFRALTRCGQWLLNRGGRSLRGQFSAIPLSDIYLHVPAREHQLDAMLDGAYEEFRRALPGATCAHEAVDRYVRALLIAGHPHDVRYLQAAMQQSGCSPSGVMAAA
ncbi:Hint domain-containing protein [Kitasatospora sp. NPDC056076]|uniref:Hint domain-containing protein n=1 Tax=Kitasatospora sp. NPDC056076 TaxID=3345703 RepID=UPI0035D5F8AF